MGWWIRLASVFEPLAQDSLFFENNILVYIINSLIYLSSYSFKNLGQQLKCFFQIWPDVKKKLETPVVEYENVWNYPEIFK